MPFKLPKHVAIVMDGNGRWAKARMLPRVEGHRRGVQTLRNIIQAARMAQIEHLSVFAFSSENWGRPKEEVEALMGFFIKGLQEEAEPLAKAGVRLHIIGDTAVFPSAFQEAIRKAESITAEATSMTLNVCANYGGQWDIIQAAKKVLEEGLELTAATLQSHLSMPWAGPVDLLIRTGGESRISNFILWQSAYSELHFSPKFWPEYSEADFREALDWYAHRERRFGLTGEQISGD